MALKGVPKSPEHRAKISAARKGMVFSAETRARMSAAKKGKPAARPFTAEDYAKSIAARKGRPLTPEHRAKLAAAKLGKPGPWAGKVRGPHSDEHRAKIGAAGLGRTVSREAREKISATLTGHYGWFTGRTHTPEAIEKTRQANRGRPPAHGKRVAYGGLVFRSQMEVDVALALDRLGVPWEYERYRFDFGDFTYAPDFFLPEDGCFWEVKGWYGPNSQLRVERFRRDLPEVPIVLVSKQCVQALTRSVRAME